MGIIHQLSHSVIKKISAGTRIEYPATIMCELIHNAIDANAQHIYVRLKNGGTHAIIVEDNGDGIAYEDLSLAVQSHTTSKIQNEKDLEKSYAIGFRGEALSLIAAVCQLQIISRHKNSKTAYKLSIDINKKINIQPTKRDVGTTVIVKDIFYNYQQKKQNIRRPHYEYRQCYNELWTRALALYNIGFTLINDGNETLHILPTQEPAQRYASLLQIDPVKTHTLTATYQKDATMSIIFTTPHLTQNKKNTVHLFINKRPMSHYGICTTIPYAFEPFLPGGIYPYDAVIHINITPSFVNFNSLTQHQDVKIRNSSEIRHIILDSIQEFLYAHYTKYDNTALTISNTASHNDSTPKLLATQTPPVETDFSSELMQQIFGHKPQKSPQRASYAEQYVAETHHHTDTSITQPKQAQYTQIQTKQGISYVGIAFDSMVLVTYNDLLYLIDIHAVHERIIFNQISENPDIQHLLIPYQFDLTEDEHTYLQTYHAAYQKEGITIRHIMHYTWEIVSMPSLFDLHKELILEYLTGKHGTIKNLRHTLYANIACKQAIKAGDLIDPNFAFEIACTAFTLSEPRCPHGRPLWTKINKTHVYKELQRII